MCSTLAVVLVYDFLSRAGGALTELVQERVERGSLLRELQARASDPDPETVTPDDEVADLQHLGPLVRQSSFSRTSGC